MSILRERPELALFLCLALGYLIGKIRVGPIQLGGICGVLIVALLIGTQNVTVDSGVKTVAFALFIFALGYVGGPQFFAHLNRSGLRFGVLSVIEVVCVVGIALTLAGAFDLDIGTASGILAGAATESAVVGTATEAIGKLGLPADQVSALQGNVATAYTVCYLFGLVTIVLFTSQLAPLLLRINLAVASRELWSKTKGGDTSLADDEQPALPSLVGRTYLVHAAAGRTISGVEGDLNGGASIESVKRGKDILHPAPDLTLREGDIVLVVGQRASAVEAGVEIGVETSSVPGLDTPLVVRDVVLTSRKLHRATVASVRRDNPELAEGGVYLTGIQRGDNDLPVARETELHRGDVVTLVGTRAKVDRIVKDFGAKIRNDTADYVYIGLGLSVGVLLGAITVRIGDVPMSLGTGGGCLISGLVFGWIRSLHPTFGAFPPAAAQTMKDLGLAVFIAVTGLAAGPHAWDLLKQYGALLPLAGIGMVLIPALLSIWVGRKLLKIEPPLLIGAIAGQQCSTPGITAITAVAKSTVPLLGYTITYTISNFLLPLTGPLLVGILGS
ncbi:aspartate-alanine antiporter [Prauserella marina]|uniref:Aspartate-alanine antiporter n=1 Tax=Prauserella marina TaxID=530584 RepID=A0A222VPP1_9PSEU|nr:aspartate-alanine antiporter [Prauserella marina]ASR35885.1 aspartate-alanine antiporter [Prauserella marina]PWV84194.1 aspartate-alanine antiporter [Prauserella marina]SDC28341.1 aspartate-alanine antiporter [Prauserella marina]